MAHAKYASVVHPHFMLTDIYIEALLVDEEASEQVWDEWNAKSSNNGAACIAWMIIAGLISPNDQHGNNRET
jgi:hypothetical protein